MPDAFKRNKIKGGGIIVCNHNHWIEPPLVAYTFPFRSVCSIIANIVVRSRKGRWFYDHINSVFIDRDNFDWQDLKKIMDKLRQEQLVLIFPESKINLTNELLEFKDGTAVLAYRANAPVYPIYIHPNHKHLHNQHIMIGKPINLHDHFDKIDQNSIKAMTKMLYDYVALMKKTLEEEIKK